MAIIVLVLILLFAIPLVIFAIQNSAMVPITFLVWNDEISLALLLLITLVIGVVIGLLVTSPSLIRRQRLASSQKKKITALEKTVTDQSLKIAQLEEFPDEKVQQPPQLVVPPAGVEQVDTAEQETFSEINPFPSLDEPGETLLDDQEGDKGF